MACFSRRIGTILLVIAALVPVQAATVSRQSADVFAKKLAQIRQQGSAVQGTAERRTPITQDEVNSWFAYQAQPMLPPGISQPQLAILGDGRVSGQATVDLEAIARRRGGNGGTLDPWSYLGGQVPVTVTGVLHTQDGRGRFELQTAEVSGVPVPATLLQEMVSFYSRTMGHPEGIRLDGPFELPANIDKIEVGQGQAVVVQ